jgi:hypothetical protein
VDTHTKEGSQNFWGSHNTGEPLVLKPTKVMRIPNEIGNDVEYSVEYSHTHTYTHTHTHTHTHRYF